MSFSIDEREMKTIDPKIEQMMDWAKANEAHAEQLALDATRLLSCTGERMDKLTQQGFFRRCWSRFIGETTTLERANVSNMDELQKYAYSYVNILQEQQILMAHSMLSLKNALLSLAVKEEKTRGLVELLAQRTLERFTQLEKRVDRLEISTNLQGWLLGLEERGYDKKIPTEYMRLFRVISDFYGIKNDEWDYNDLMFMRKAIRTVGIDPEKKLSLNSFITGLIDEIQTVGIGFDAYKQAITFHTPHGIENYSQYAIDNISSPIFVAMHGLKNQYTGSLDTVNKMEDVLGVPKSEALKILLCSNVADLNVNLDYEFPLAEASIEILGCIRLMEKLNINPFIDDETKMPSNTATEARNYLSETRTALNDLSSASENIVSEMTDEDSQHKNDDINLANFAQDENNTQDHVNDSKIDYALILQANLCLNVDNDSKKSYYIRGDDVNVNIMKKIDNGRKYIAPHIQFKDIVVYYDGTLTGGGEDGLIITEDCIYVRDFIRGRDSMRLDAICSVRMEGDNIFFHDGSRQIEYFFLDKYVLGDIYDVFQYILHNDGNTDTWLVSFSDICELLGATVGKNKSSYYVKGLPFDNAIMKKIRNAINTYAQVVEFEDIIAYYDDTTFGKGDVGFILTNNKLYFNDSNYGSHSLFPSVSEGFFMSSSHICIKIEDNIFKIPCGNSDVRHELFCALTRIECNNYLGKTTRLLEAMCHRLSNSL